MATKISWYANPYGSKASQGTDQCTLDEAAHPSHSNEITKGGPPAHATGSRRYSGFLVGCLVVSIGANRS